MATFHGKNGVVEADGTAVAEIRSFSVEQAASTVDDTVMGDDWDTHLVTRNSWSGTIECLWDDTAVTGNVTNISVGDTVALAMYPEGDDTGGYELTGSATIETLSTSQSHDGAIEVSFAYKGNGALTIGTAT